MPEMLSLHGWLAAHIPAGDADPAGTRISHGDYRCAGHEQRAREVRHANGSRAEAACALQRRRHVMRTQHPGAFAAGAHLLITFYSCASPHTKARQLHVHPPAGQPCVLQVPFFIHDMYGYNHSAARLDNLVFCKSDPSRVLAVLDWELSTLGDPLSDLAYSCLPYHLPSVRAGAGGRCLCSACALPGCAHSARVRPPPAQEGGHRGVAERAPRAWSRLLQHALWSACAANSPVSPAPPPVPASRTSPTSCLCRTRCQLAS